MCLTLYSKHIKNDNILTISSRIDLKVFNQWGSFNICTFSLFGFFTLDNESDSEMNFLVRVKNVSDTSFIVKIWVKLPYLPTRVPMLKI